MRKVIEALVVQYHRPEVISHQPVRFETAQSWNKGKGNEDKPGNGNGGTNYPNEPYTGEQNGNGAGKGHGNGGGNGNGGGLGNTN